MSTQHTPIPWVSLGGTIRSRDRWIATTRPPQITSTAAALEAYQDRVEEDKANGDLIVLAVNNHDALLEAARAGRDALYAAQGEWVDVLPPYAPEWTYPLKNAAEIMDAAIAAAEGRRDRLSRLFACDCAEHVLHIFETRYPDDKRPRQAIQVARDFTNGTATTEQLAAAGDAAGDAAWAAAEDTAWTAAWATRAATRDAAWAAARAAAGDAAWAAAGDAAGDAAWAAAEDTAGAAAWAAARAAAWDAAWAAAEDTARAAAWDAAWDAERQWQKERFLAYLNAAEGRTA